MMPALIFAAGYDTPGKRDATHAFHPEARRYQQVRGGKLVHVDNRKDVATRAEAVLEEIARNGRQPWKTIAFFCHGTAKSIQLGFDLRTVGELGRYIAGTSERDVRVLLYCCSTASTLKRILGAPAPGGDGGFADELRDALCRHGATRCRVMAHDTVGHTTKNPHVRLFDGQESPIGGQGGEMPVRPGGKLWTAWREALAGKFMAGSDFRFHMPFMEIGEIHAALVSGTL
jgi:hypothetical protein